MGVGRVTGHRGLELYGGHTAEAALAAEPVVGLLDPAEDRNVEVLAGCPATAGRARCPVGAPRSIPPQWRDQLSEVLG